jgi:cytochrome c553
MRRSVLIAMVLAAAALLDGPTSGAAEDDFWAELARIDQAIKKNPSRVPIPAVDSCIGRRNAAARLYRIGQATRAFRSLAFCRSVLKVGDAKPETIATGPSIEEIQARAAREVEKALTLTPNLDNGLEIYRTCAMCHKPEGWGFENGTVPQLAGQHRKVVIKQLADIRAGNRDAVLMAPYATVESIGGTQAVADVAGYIDTLEISIDTGKGKGDDLEFGQQLYADNCVRCHGATGEGDGDGYIPRIQSQHYNYLVRQFEWIRDGERRNANPEMVEQIQGFDDRQTRALADYVSRLEPPEDLRAPADWRNPDFAN